MPQRLSDVGGIDADADDRARDDPCGERDFRLDENAAHLFSAEICLVRVPDLGRNAARPPDTVGDGGSAPFAQAVGLGKRQRKGEGDRHIDALVLRRKKGSAVVPLSLGLAFGNDDAFARLAEFQLCDGVGRRNRVVTIDAHARTLRDDCGGQEIAFPVQHISLVGDRVDVVSVRRQRLHGFPHRLTGDAQRLGQGFARNEAAAAGFEIFQNALFYAHVSILTQEMPKVKF